MSFSNQTVFSVQSFAGDEDLVCIRTYVSVKEISASWKLFLGNSILRVSFFRCFLIFLSESGLFLSESFLSNPFLISFQDHFPQTSLSRSSVSRYTVRLQELFQKRFKSFKMNIIPSQYSISMLCCRKPYVENYPFHSFVLGNVGEARESKNISSHKFFSIDFPWSRL